MHKLMLLSFSYISFSNEMSLLYGGKRGDSGHYGDGDDRPKCQGDSNEKQESRCLVRCGVREAAAPAHRKCRKLVHDFYHNYHTCPNPQPLRQLKYWQEFPGTTRHEADVCHAIQQCAPLGDAIQLPGQPSVGHVADAAESIDYPKCHSRNITMEQTQRACNPE